MRLLPLLPLVLAVACIAPETDPSDGGLEEETDAGPHCQPGDFLPFTSSDSGAADHLKAQEEILGELDLAESVPASAAARFTTIEQIYAQRLAAAVKELRDVRAGGSAAAGRELDAWITGAVAVGKSATQELELGLLKARLDTALLHFLALSVQQHLARGAFAGHDAAFGHLGSGRSNEELGRRGLARLATSIDVAAGSSYAANLFGLLKDGGCELSRGLSELKVEAQPDLAKLPGYQATVDGMNVMLQRLFASALLVSTSQLAGKSPEAAQVDLEAAAGLFRYLEPGLDAGSADAREAATQLRSALEGARSAAKAGSQDWNTAFEHAGLEAALEKAYGVQLLAAPQ